MKVSLTELTEEYIEQVRVWRNSEHVAKYMYSDDYISTEQQKKWFDKIKTDKTKKYLLVFVEKKVVGLISFREIDYIDKTASWAFYLGDNNYSSTGIGVGMEYLSIEYAFNQLNLVKLNCEVMCFNEKVINLHNKFGFEKIKIFKKKIKKKVIKVISMSLMVNIWKNNKKKFKRIVEKKFS